MAPPRLRRPAPHGRAPLRRGRTVSYSRGHTGRPAPHGRAPLRLGGQGVVGVETKSSRPSRAGSVAARCCGPPRRSSSRSSRPSRAGSVAASPGMRCAAGQVRRPAPHGRAPLRRCRGRRSRRRSLPVVPPLTGGLRCGVILVVWVAAGIEGRPAPHGRAPLRQADAGRHVAGHGSSRPSRAGSVAAFWKPAISGGPLRRPAPHGRAPLRQPEARLLRHRGRASSRPSRAGSVAATAWTCTTAPGTARSSRPSRAGSVAA